MIKYITILILMTGLILGITLSCTDDEDCPEGYKPWDCNEDRPTQGEVTIKVTINHLNYSVPITIYRGPIENEDIMREDNVSTSEKTYILPNNDYSIKAKYNAIIDGQEAIVYSVDGAHLEPDEEDYCDGTCYEEGEIELDATLDEDLWKENQ